MNFGKVIISLTIAGFLCLSGFVVYALGGQVSDSIATNHQRILEEQKMVEEAAAADEERENIATEFLRSNSEYSALDQTITEEFSDDQIKEVLLRENIQQRVSPDKLPNLLRGELPEVTLHTITQRPKLSKPPRMCEMPEDYFTTQIVADHNLRPGYTEENGFVRRYKPRRGFLNDRELQAAKVAWGYFEQFTQEDTGLANSVGAYPSTTLWDTASYISGLVSAYEL